MICDILITVNVNLNKLSMRTISDYFNINIWVKWFDFNSCITRPNFRPFFKQPFFDILKIGSNRFRPNHLGCVLTGFGLVRNYYFWQQISWTQPAEKSVYVGYSYRIGENTWNGAFQATDILTLILFLAQNLYIGSFNQFLQPLHTLFI